FVFDLSSAATWARAALLRLPSARRAGRLSQPNHWDREADRLSALLSIYLACKHAQRVVAAAPDTGLPMDREELDRLVRRAELFRNVLMHFEKKVTGGLPMSLGSDENGAEVSFTRGQRKLTSLSWTEVEAASKKIEAWA